MDRIRKSKLEGEEKNHGSTRIHPDGKKGGGQLNAGFGASLAFAVRIPKTKKNHRPLRSRAQRIAEGRPADCSGIWVGLEPGTAPFLIFLSSVSPAVHPLSHPFSSDSSETSGFRVPSICRCRTRRPGRGWPSGFPLSCPVCRRIGTARGTEYCRRRRPGRIPTRTSGGPRD